MDPNFQRETEEVHNETATELVQLLADAAHTGQIPPRCRLEAIVQSNGEGVRAAYAGAVSHHGHHNGPAVQDRTDGNEYMEMRSGRDGGHDGAPVGYMPYA